MNNTQTILNLQAEIESLRAKLAQPTPSQSELEITASNNFQAMEIVTNYLIEIDALTITHEGEGEAAGLNIVESIKKHIASVKAQPTSQELDTKRIDWLQLNLDSALTRENIDKAMREGK